MFEDCVFHISPLDRLRAIAAFAFGSAQRIGELVMSCTLDVLWQDGFVVLPAGYGVPDGSDRQNLCLKIYDGYICTRDRNHDDDHASWIGPNYTADVQSMGQNRELLARWTQDDQQVWTSPHFTHLTRRD